MDFPQEFADVKRRMVNLGLSGEGLHRLMSDVSTASLSRWFSGKSSYREKGILQSLRNIQRLLGQLEDLQRRHGPAKLNLNETACVLMMILQAKFEPPTKADWDLLQSIRTGDTDYQIAMRLGVPLSELQGRLEIAQIRIVNLLRERQEATRKELQNKIPTQVK